MMKQSLSGEVLRKMIKVGTSSFPLFQGFLFMTQNGFENIWKESALFEY